MMHSLHVTSFANRSGAGKVSASAGAQSLSCIYQMSIIKEEVLKLRCLYIKCQSSRKKF